jgi:hypothetical protein
MNSPSWDHSWWLRVRYLQTARNKTAAGLEVLTYEARAGDLKVRWSKADSRPEILCVQHKNFA